MNDSSVRHVGLDVAVGLSIFDMGGGSLSGPEFSKG